jgi:hypothetical protein
MFAGKRDETRGRKGSIKQMGKSAVGLLQTIDSAPVQPLKMPNGNYMCVPPGIYATQLTALPGATICVRIRISAATSGE